MSDSREKINLVYLTYLLQILQARIILHLAIPFSVNSILSVAVDLHAIHVYCRLSFNVLVNGIPFRYSFRHTENIIKLQCTLVKGINITLFSVKERNFFFGVFFRKTVLLAISKLIRWHYLKFPQFESKGFFNCDTNCISQLDKPRHFILQRRSLDTRCI